MTELNRRLFSRSGTGRKDSRSTQRFMSVKFRVLRISDKIPTEHFHEPNVIPLVCRHPNVQLSTRLAGVHLYVFGTAVLRTVLNENAGYDGLQWARIIRNVGIKV